MINWLKTFTLFIQRGYFSKRELGGLISLVGIAGIFGPLLIDLVGAGNFAGIGPTQRLVMLISGVMTLLGLSLIPLGDNPA